MSLHGKFEAVIAEKLKKRSFVPLLEGADKPIISGKTELYSLADKFVRYLIGAGFALTIISMVGAMYLDIKMKDAIRDSWAIFIPIISLIIGYVFGKDKK